MTTVHRRIHYGWIIIALTFLVMLITAAVRATPGVLIPPLEREFGWDRTTISGAVALNMLLYGLMGPFAGALMQRIGMRRTILLALCIVTIGLLLTTRVTASWHLIVLWGGVIGAGTGMTALVLGATAVNRWFVERRGFAIGILTAGNATGQLVFLPWLAFVVSTLGWQYTVLIVAAVAAALIRYGWVFAGHQIGAAIAALGAGAIRQAEGSYLPAFLLAGATCLIGALLVLRLKIPRLPTPAVA
jgi:MFS family permease